VKERAHKTFPYPSLNPSHLIPCKGGGYIINRSWSTGSICSPLVDSDQQTHSTHTHTHTSSSVSKFHQPTQNGRSNCQVSCQIRIFGETITDPTSFKSLQRISKNPPHECIVDFRAPFDPNTANNILCEEWSRFKDVPNDETFFFGKPK